MFKFLLAFIVWLFATGEYSKWIALVQTGNTSSSTGTSGTNAPGASASSGNSSAGAANSLQGIIGAFGSLTNGLAANSSASGTSTPADLISGYTS